jgi:hypothetical protein
MAKFNIVYDGEVLHKAVSYEKSTEILDELAEKFYNNGEFNPELLELEEVTD